MSFLAITAIFAAIGFILMMANGCAGGKVGDKAIWAIMLLSFCCSVIGVVCGSAGFMNLYNVNTSTWTSPAFYSGRPGFALAIVACIMAGLQIIALTATTCCCRPAPAPPKAPEPAVAAAPADAFTGANPQYPGGAPVSYVAPAATGAAV